jgi:IS5 family transposase
VLIFTWILIKFVQKPENHVKKLPVQPKLEMFNTVLGSFINPEYELCKLAKKIDWTSLEKEFEPLYGTVGRPSIPIRTIVGLL